MLQPSETFFNHKYQFTNFQYGSSRSLFRASIVAKLSFTKKLKQVVQIICYKE
jgi:hypothetical protein